MIKEGKEVINQTKADFIKTAQESRRNYGKYYP